MGALKITAMQSAHQTIMDGRRWEWRSRHTILMPVAWTGKDQCRRDRCQRRGRPAG
jgi:hypothetical protein